MTRHHRSRGTAAWAVMILFAMSAALLVVSIAHPFSHSLSPGGAGFAVRGGFVRVWQSPPAAFVLKARLDREGVVESLSRRSAWAFWMGANRYDTVNYRMIVSTQTTTSPGLFTLHTVPQVNVPLATTTGASSLLVLLLVVIAPVARRRRARRLGRCVGCGYDLTGNVSGRCPECGNPVPPRDLTPETANRD